jgi:hypothetical protein
MKVIVDTCGWIEWLTDGLLADEFSNYLGNLDNLIVSTSIHNMNCTNGFVVNKMKN